MMAIPNPVMNCIPNKISSATIDLAAPNVLKDGLRPSIELGISEADCINSSFFFCPSHMAAATCGTNQLYL
jgi:hypothetical protein